ncbi:MAG TPA: transposase [Paludibacter sp.]|nr:transposase [Paludibacter sp.]HPM09874.1 transposase [Paludibacter sp.]
MPSQQTQLQQYDPAVYTQRSPNILKAILKNHFQSFSDKYSEKYDTEYGKIRLERIDSFKDSLISCGDYTKGIARIQCSNPECKHEIFRPFSCKRFYFCPSCSQKRAILFGEHISNEVLFKLPHRHFVFAFPKMLRLFFRNNKKVLSDIARLICEMIIEYYKMLTGKEIRTGIVLAFQSYGDFLRYNPHFHALIMEGGLAKNLLSWKHSGFSIDNSIRVATSDNKAREAIAQYMARCPISLNKIIYEPFKGKVIFKTKYNKYFKENHKVYDADEFIAKLVQHIPLPRIRLIRYFDLYSSKSRGKWKDWDHVSKLAPDGWKEQNGIGIQGEEIEKTG